MMGDSVFWGDAFRVANIVAAAVVLGLALWVTVNYAVACRRIKRDGAKWEGLLPRHVALIGLSYTMFVGMVLILFIGSLNSPVTWYHGCFLVAHVLGAWALRDMTGHQRHRKVQLPGEPDRPTLR